MPFMKKFNWQRNHGHANTTLPHVSVMSPFTTVVGRIRKQKGSPTCSVPSLVFLAPCSYFLRAAAV